MTPKRRASSADSGAHGQLVRYLELLVWLPIAALIVLPQIHTFTELSKVDEYQHVDYLVHISHLDQVKGGEKVGEVAMREQACRGSDLEGFDYPPCRSKHLDPGQFPGAGYNHTYADPPTYYLVTAASASVVQHLTGVDSIVTAGRAIGVFWLAGGLALTYALARRLGAGRAAAAGAGLLIGTTGNVVLASATITTDAPQLLVGGMLCLVALAVTEGRRAWWWLGLAAAAATAVKITSLAVVGLVAVFVVASFVADRRRGRLASSEPAATEPSEPPARPRRYVAMLVALLVGALIPSLVWGAVSTATALPSVDDIPMAEQFRVSHISWAGLSESVIQVWSPVARPETPPLLRSDSMEVMSDVLNLLLIAATLGVAWFGVRVGAAARMAGATAAAMALTGPAFSVLIFVTLHAAYWIPSRYGISLLPAAAAALAVAASTRRGGAAGLLGLGGLSLLALLAQTL